MIYLIDEDRDPAWVWKVHLKEAGYAVMWIKDADTAFEVLSTANDVEFVGIDVMLAARDKSERFTEVRTSNFMTSGLGLLEDLVAANPKYFPKRAVFFTNMSKTSPNYRTLIAATLERHKVDWIEKTTLGKEELLDRVRRIAMVDLNRGENR